MKTEKENLKNGLWEHMEGESLEWNSSIALSCLFLCLYREEMPVQIQG